MTWPPPSTVVMPGGTVKGLVTSPQSAVNVKVLPLIVPVHAAVMDPPAMGAALATSTQLPALKTRGTAIVVATTARLTRNRDIPTPRTVLYRGQVGAPYRDANTPGRMPYRNARTTGRIELQALADAEGQARAQPAPG